MIRAQIDDKLITIFPNVNIAFRIYFSIFGTSAEGERSFSKMKLIKTISDQQWGSNDCRHFHYVQLKMLCDNCHSTRFLNLHIKMSQSEHLNIKLKVSTKPTLLCPWLNRRGCWETRRLKLLFLSFKYLNKYFKLKFAVFLFGDFFKWNVGFKRL
jgi:hypothetical protein